MISRIHLPLRLLTFFVMFSICSTARARTLDADGTDFKVALRALEDLSQADFAVLHQHSLDARYGQYVAPNEMQPDLMLPLIQNAKPGMLISVGTQRCLMVAAKLEQITKVHCFDMDHGVAFFNLLNIRLLALAKERTDFLYLALDAPVEEWRKRFAGSPMTKDMIEDLFEFWNLHFRINPLNRFFVGPTTPITFAGMNYLYDDVLFQRLQTLARNHAIEVDWINIVRINQLVTFVDELKREGQTLSILDLSNIGDWTGTKLLAPAILQFGPITTPDTIVLQSAIENVFWIYGAFQLTAENREHLKNQNAIPDDFVLTEGTPLNEMFSMKISRLNCQKLNCAKFKEDFHQVGRFWDEYLGPEK